MPTTLEQMRNRLTELRARMNETDPDTDYAAWEAVDDEMQAVLHWLRLHDPIRIANDLAELDAELTEV